MQTKLTIFLLNLYALISLILAKGWSPMNQAQNGNETETAP